MVVARGASVAVTQNDAHPTNTRRLSKVGLMLGQRRRRWPSIKPTLDQRLVFVGLTVGKNYIYIQILHVIFTLFLLYYVDFFYF